MLLLTVLLALVGWAAGQTPSLLQLEKVVELPDVEGRIDHMSVDVRGQRLFVSALGNNTVEVIDFREGKRIKTIGGLKEPQGVLYVPESDRLYVANGKDGSVRIFDGTSYALLKAIEFGDDADNLRYDARHRRVYVGYGGGAIAAIDNQGNRGDEIKLDAHPESFQLDKDNSRIYVNLPSSHKVAVLDLDKHSIVTKWETGTAFANYPMTLDEADHRLFVVTRMPACLLVFDTESGKIIQTLPVVGDCDDVFYDKAGKRIYASGGEGAISVIDQKDADHYTETGRIPTLKGARTSFFSADVDRLFLAVRRQGSQPAAIRILVPSAQP
jgi:DNA-binding beta-propeller fold protein YncE